MKQRKTMLLNRKIFAKLGKAVFLESNDDKQNHSDSIRFGCCWYFKFCTECGVLHVFFFSLAVSLDFSKMTRLRYIPMAFEHECHSV